MKFYEYGKENRKSIMLLPGNLMTHRQFELLVPMLEKDYHIIMVSFDGFDETGKTTYTTAKKQAEKLVAYIRKYLNGRIDIPMDCWYGEKESNMKKAIKILKKAFPNIEVHSFAGLGHGEIVNNEALLIKEIEIFLKKNVINQNGKRKYRNNRK